MQATASITAQNFLAPGEDLGYKVEYRHPYFFSARDPKRTALALSIFNARKISGVFTPGEDLGPPSPVAECWYASGMDPSLHAPLANSMWGAVFVVSCSAKHTL